MASSKSSSVPQGQGLNRRASFLWLPFHHRAKEEEITVVVSETQDESESDLAASETASGSSVGDTTPRRSPPLRPRPDEKGRGTQDKSDKLKRRKSMFNMLTSLVPTLTSSPPTDLPTAQQQQLPQQLHQQHPQQQQQQQHQQEAQHPNIHRRPVPSQQQVPTGYWQPVRPIYVIPGPPPGAPGAYVPTSAVVPPMPLEAPPPPPKAHGRNNSLPTMLKKERKGAASPSPPAAQKLTVTEPQTRGRGQSPGARPPSSSGKLQPHRLQPRQPRQSSPSSGHHRGRSTSAQPPISRSGAEETPRATSNPAHSPAKSPAPSDGGDSPGAKSKRRSWLLGGRSRAGSVDLDVTSRPGAWLITPGGTADYNTSILVNGEKVPELWSEVGTICVFLYPKDHVSGPSFKVADHVFATSRVLNELLLSENAIGGSTGSSLLTADDAVRRQSTSGVGPGDYRLYLPLANTDVETLIAARNLFALLTEQPLVGMKKSPTAFAALLQVADLLRDFGFSSCDGSSYGEEVDAAFDSVVEQLGLADVRESREKTLEALVLAEQMRSWSLYNEAFAHAVGKYDDLLELNSPLFSQISVSTRNRLERANLSLMNCEQSVHQRLTSFDFPGLFAGIASSTSHDEYKTVNFKEWRNSFGKMRNFVLGYYKDLFGNWPPKAKSKKNRFSRGGLNRQALRILYWDLCSLYDLMVDRENPTTRAIDDQSVEEGDEPPSNPSISALRKLLTEFDASSPPVLPPIPFDVPKLPTMTTIRENYNDLPSKQQAKFDKSIQPNELLLLLIKSRNLDTDALDRPFLNAFKEFELREARGIHPQELGQQRIGHWLFLYVVLQCLPMLVVDAPDLKYTEGVEYFLCQAPQGNPPWNEEAGEVRKMWYRAGNQNLVELSTDVVMFSVEGIYTRSHCWMAAKRWAEASSSASGRPNSAGAHPEDEDLSSDLVEGASPLAPPRSVFQDMDPVTNQNSSPTGSPHLRPRSGPRGNNAYRFSVSMGLEPVNLGDERGGPPPRVMSGASSHGSRQSSISGFDGVVGPQPHLRQDSKSPSISNLRQAQSEASLVGQGQSTFDDILKGMEKEKKKKRSFF